MIEVLQRRLSHPKGIFTSGRGSSVPWSLTALILGLLAGLMCPYQALALSSTPNSSTWITSGTPTGEITGSVYAIVDNGTTIYIGGDFNYVGPNTGFGVPLGAATGSPVSTFPKVNDAVWTAVSDGAGGWYIGGLFTKVGNYDRNGVAHVLSDGTVDPGWDPNAESGVVYALAVSGGTVYAGGDFNNIGGQDRNYIAALDAATGFATPWNPNADDVLYALAMSGGTVYTGGWFTNIGGQDRNCIAALDVATGLATTWNPNADSAVLALAASVSTVYTGGYLTNIGGQDRNYIAALDAASGLATAWNPNADNTVWTLAISGSTVYAGGDFTNIGGKLRNYIAALNTVDAAATSWDPNATDSVRTLTVSGSNVYVGGYFASVGGKTRNNLAALNATTGAATSWDPNANGPVYALAMMGTKLYAGGDFTTMGGSSRLCIARFTTTTGALDSYSRNFDGAIRAMEVVGTNLYIGGEFTTVSSNELPFLTKLNSSGIIQTDWKPSPDNFVYALTGSDTTVYVGGEFTSIGGQLRNYIAALKTSDATATSWDPNASYIVNALKLSGATVYAGGEFVFIGAQTPQPMRPNIAALNVVDGSATSWNPFANGTVLALAVSGSTVYAGGDFTTIGAQFSQPTRNHVAALKATDNGTATVWNPDVNDLTAGASVQALAVGPSRLHIGGYFTTVGGASHPFLARFDGSTAVQMKSFTAEASGVDISLSWKTGAEVDCAAFRLWRSKYINEAYKVIKRSCIPSEGSAVQGAEYTYEDADVELGTTYYYRLEAIDNTGKGDFHGPVSATVGSIVLTFPKDGVTMSAKIPASFKWSSRGFNRFQIQFSSDSSFMSGVLTLPQSMGGQVGLKSGPWIKEELYRPTSKERREIINLARRGNHLYWRVYGENDAGNGLTSEASQVVIK